MSDLSENIPTEEFTRWVHDALNHLYDSAFLDTHPLSNVLISEQERTLRSSQALRKVLLKGIQSFHPEKDVPEHSPDWRAYHILELRYISGMSSVEVMQRMGLGRSLYFLEQARALQALAEHLWLHKPSPPNFPEDLLGERVEVVDAEVHRLIGRAIWKEVDLSGLLNELKPVVVALAETYKATITFQLDDAVVIRHADRVLMRQVLLNLIAMGIERAHSGKLEVASFKMDEQPQISLRAEGIKDRASRQEIFQEPAISLTTCRVLLAEMQGQIELGYLANGDWQVHLTWLSSQQPRILMVIDDNEGVVELFRRYLTGTTWQVMGASNGEAARQILTQTRPVVIILDVILPEEDGWELLLEIKANPETRATPVIICSALSESQLATSLGAVNFLPKPVTQIALMNVLRPWIG